MYAAVSRFEGAIDRLPVVAARPALERAEGAVRLAFDSAQGRSRLIEAHQRGSLKVRFPRQYGQYAGTMPEAVLLNTAGGITGGDRFSIEATLTGRAALTLTTQAAEKVYRSPGGEGAVEARLNLSAGTRAHWLPQETILFEGGRLRRRLHVDMAADATLVACESVVLGRAAHGETVRTGKISDRWDIRRQGRLIFADRLRVAGEVDVRGMGKATLGGGRAFASLIVVAPDAEARLDAARAALEGVPAIAGASAWDGILSARIVAADGAGLRATLLRLVAAAGVTVPRAWSI